MPDAGHAFWQRTASRYDLSMRVIGAPLHASLPTIVEAVRGRERVLEVAAGTGLVTRAVAPVVGSLVATDYAPAMVEQLDTRLAEEGLPEVQTRVLDLFTLDGSERFDAIIAANVLHLVPDMDAALAALTRALEPGGRLVVPTYAHAETAVSGVVSRLMGLAGFPGQRRLTLADLLEAVRAQGLTPLRAEVVPGLLPMALVVAEAH